MNSLLRFTWFLVVRGLGLVPKALYSVMDPKVRDIALFFERL